MIAENLSCRFIPPARVRSQRLVVASFCVLVLISSDTVGAGANDATAFQFDKKSDRLLISWRNQPASEYVFQDTKILRPYFTRVKTMMGLQVTRNHPPVAETDATDHETMHPGIWLGFGDISGHDFWRNQARIEHLRFLDEPHAMDDTLRFSTESMLRDSMNQPMGKMICRFTIVARPSGWLIVWDSTFIADSGDLVFGDQEEMGFGARVATSLTEKNTGRILNSEGQLTAAKTWGQPANWCDYSGTSGEQQGGITLMASAANFRGSWWHNRDYGVFVSNPFGRSAMKQGTLSSTVVKKGASLRIAFGAFVHDQIDIDVASEYIEFEKIVKK